MMFCPKCGMKSIGGGVFCQKCGARLFHETAPQLELPDPADGNTPQETDSNALDGVTAAAGLDATLMNVGDLKIKVIAAMNKWIGIGIGEGKELVEKAPVLLKRNITMEEAEFIKHTFTKAGADISFTDQSGQTVNVIPHCRECGTVLDADSDTCRSCGHSLNVPPAFKKGDSGGQDDSVDWGEVWDEFMSQTLTKKIFIVSGLLAAALLAVLILRIICSSLITLVAIPTGIYFIYQYWGADYVTKFIYDKSSKELQLPDGMTSQTLIEALSGKFNYPYFKGARHGTKGECLIEGKYAVYQVVFDDGSQALLTCDAANNNEKIRTILREAIAVRSYINKFFNPDLPFDAAKELKTLKSTERQRKAVKFVVSFAVAVLVIIGSFENAVPGGLQYIMNPGMEVRQACLSQYSESVTIEEAFENFFDNRKWSEYEADGYSYVAFTGACEYQGERADVRVTFKITGEQFVVDSLDINGSMQDDFTLYILLKKVYENYQREG